MHFVKHFVMLCVFMQCDVTGDINHAMIYQQQLRQVFHMSNAALCSVVYLSILTIGLFASCDCHYIRFHSISCDMTCCSVAQCSAVTRGAAQCTTQ